MNCQRAAEVLKGLVKNQLVADFDEIELLLSLALIVEADPDDLATTNWLAPVLREHAHVYLADPRAADTVAQVLRETEERLKSDWFRIKSSKEEIAQLDARRITLRRALAVLRDPIASGAIHKIATAAHQLAPGAEYVPCPTLGSELYALTHKGWRIRGQLKLKAERFGEASFKSFVHSFDKSEQKMLAFANDIAALSANVGYVKKNREQIVIGLAKSGLPAAEATSAYHATLSKAQAPDVAVTCIRNAATHGSPEKAAKRLRQAQNALGQAGFGGSPVVQGAAKSLLGFAPEPGIQRFVELHRQLERAFGRQPNELLVRFTSRLMPATGTPSAIVGRVVAAASSLALQSPNKERAASKDVRAAAVALASMVKTQDAVPEIVARFRQVEAELVRAGISSLHNAEADALECVACPGTPAEVAATVGALLGQLASGRQPARGDVAIACAFAKRFSF